MSVVKGVAQALKEVVEMGGRITEESADFLEKLLGDELDELQEDAQEFVAAVEKVAKSRLAEIEEKLDELVQRIEQVTPDKPATSVTKNPATSAVKKASTTK